MPACNERCAGELYYNPSLPDGDAPFSYYTKDIPGSYNYQNAPECTGLDLGSSVPAESRMARQFRIFQQVKLVFGTPRQRSRKNLAGALRS